MKKNYSLNFRNSRDSINAGISQILKDLKGTSSVSEKEGFSDKCPHCNQLHPSIFEFCPLTGKKIAPISNVPAGTILPISRIYTSDRHVVRNGFVHCVDCDSTNVEEHNRNALQYTCKDCGLRFGNGGGENYDAEKNKISSYFKIFDLVLGITKKTEINPSLIKQCEDDLSLLLIEGSNILIPNNDGELLLNKVIFRDDIRIQDCEYYIESSIPKFYNKLGIWFGSEMKHNMDTFLDLGFDLVKFDEGLYCGPSLRVTLPWSKKYQSYLILDLEYWDEAEGYGGLRELCITACDTITK